MDTLHVDAEFCERSRESQEIIKKVFNRLTENEYVQIRVKRQSKVPVHKQLDTLKQICALKESVVEKTRLINKIVNEVKSETLALFSIIRNYAVKFELRAVYNIWLSIMGRFVTPCMSKLIALDVEADTVEETDFDRKKKIIMW